MFPLILVIYDPVLVAHVGSSCCCLWWWWSQVVIILGLKFWAWGGLGAWGGGPKWWGNIATATGGRGVIFINAGRGP
jgi:hypothetical protein